MRILQHNVKRSTRRCSLLRQRGMFRKLFVFLVLDVFVYVAWQTVQSIKEHVQYNRKYSNDITIVTGYLDIGEFKKGDFGFHTRALYRSWLYAWSSVSNPVVFYTDKNDTAEIFRVIRGNLTTKIVLLANVSDLWAHSLLPATRSIFKKPGYPKHWPNTVVPEYSFAMHAKYDFVEDAILRDLYSTKYYAWIDAGYFRRLVNDPPYKLVIPQDFYPKYISYTEIWKPNFRHSVHDIFHHNHVWVAGGMFLAERTVMMSWIPEYRSYVEHFLDLGYASTDQQVLYAMFTQTAQKRAPQNFIQTWRGHGLPGDLQWFYLGLLCKETWQALTLPMENMEQLVVLSSQYKNRFYPYGGRAGLLPS